MSDRMTENTDEEQIERSNSRIAELLRERDALATALRRIKSLDEKNVQKYAQQIASEALQEGAKP